jgi:ABC-type uncharacterized transport system permease subunit
VRSKLVSNFENPQIVIAALTLAILHGFLLSLQENAGITFQIVHDFQGPIIIIIIIKYYNNKHHFIVIFVIYKCIMWAG